MLYPMRPRTPLVLPPSPEEFWVQWKYNGWNVVIPGDGTAWTRHGNEITDWRCWEGVNLHLDFPLNVELCAESGRLEDVPGLRNGSKRPMRVVHDFMLENVPIEDRLPLFTSLDDSWTIANTVGRGSWEGINEEFDLSLAAGHEGLVLKRKGSSYVVGQVASVSSPDWLRLRVRVRCS